MESLFNDASGIILVAAMALWVKNGQFNYQQTFFDFLRSAGGGIIIGILAALVMISFRQFLGGELTMMLILRKYYYLLVRHSLLTL